jgi:hypothetical protein
MLASVFNICEDGIIQSTKLLQLATKSDFYSHFGIVYIIFIVAT